MEQEMILFDFEYTAWEGSKVRKWSEPWEHREIYQIAAVRVSINATLSVMENFECLVKPKQNPDLSSYIIRLTGIQQAAIDQDGLPFPQVFAMFYSFCEQGRRPLFCYGDDPAVLLENLALNKMDRPAFPAGVYDIRTIFEQAGVDTGPYTSGTIHKAVGIDFPHAAHNALNDVRSLAVTIQHLMRGKKFSLTTDNLSKAKFLTI
jgi:inhibitor of KinA sporulation pathway (predicted exonuclease)